MSTPSYNPTPGQGEPDRDAGRDTPQQPTGQDPTGNQPQSPYGYQNPQPSGSGYPGNMGQVSMAEKGPAPKEVERAFWLIIAAGVLSFISTIISPTTTQMGGAAAGATMALTIVFAAVVTGVYILLAVFIRKGHNWARITAAVLAGLSVASYLFGLISLSVLQGSDALEGQELATPGPLATVLGVLVLLLGIAGVVMTFLKPARPYFRKQSAQY